MRYMALMVLATASVLLLAGCTEKPQTPPATSSGPSSTAALPYADAPRVGNPMPATVIQRDPCEVLTPAQISSLFQRQPEVQPAQDTGIARDCRWADISRGSSIGIQMLYAARDGLSQFYANKQRYKLWEPLEPVQGYPVVAYGGNDTRQTLGDCAVLVGVADNAVFEVDVNVVDSKVGTVDPCTDARMVADLAVTTLKSGA
ncbi:DUF3558 domain-containing protein [Amycolatopsis sp. NPDC051071]|uniref:DUF3558 domain-containing protein n=1 Tax=Amycolatopsis sp. NPDC051071 TaxID=3154637 RepID=UPI003449AC5E